MKPLVSILIITMNHEKFIEQACKSAISQTYPNLEIILLDNKSDDKTFEIAKSVLSGSNIPHKLIENTEKFGVSKNLNILVANSSGEYISILSGDDWYKENMVEKKVDFIQNTDYDFVLSDGFVYIEETGETKPVYALSKKNKIINSLTNFFYENVVENQTVNVGTFIRKKLLQKYPFDENLNTEDWDMNLRMTSLGYKIGFIDEKLFYYRILSTSLSRKWEIMEDSYKKVTSKYIHLIESHKILYKKYKINLLKFKYEIILSKTVDCSLQKKIKKEWKKKKYRIKYKQPLLFFKLLFLK